MVTCTFLITCYVFHHPSVQPALEIFRQFSSDSWISLIGIKRKFCKNKKEVFPGLAPTITTLKSEIKFQNRYSYLSRFRQRLFSVKETSSTSNKFQFIRIRRDFAFHSIFIDNISFFSLCCGTNNKEITKLQHSTLAQTVSVLTWCPEWLVTAIYIYYYEVACVLPHSADEKR